MIYELVIEENDHLAGVVKTLLVFVYVGWGGIRMPIAQYSNFKDCIINYGKIIIDELHYLFKKVIFI